MLSVDIWTNYTSLSSCDNSDYFNGKDKGQVKIEYSSDWFQVISSKIQNIDWFIQDNPVHVKFDGWSFYGLFEIIFIVHVGKYGKLNTVKIVIRKWDSCNLFS